MVPKLVRKKRKLGRKIQSYWSLCRSLHEQGMRPYSKVLIEAGNRWRKINKK